MHLASSCQAQAGTGLKHLSPVCFFFFRLDLSKTLHPPHSSLHRNRTGKLPELHWLARSLHEAAWR